MAFHGYIFVLIKGCGNTSTFKEIMAIYIAAEERKIDEIQIDGRLLGIDPERINIHRPIRLTIPHVRAK